MKGTVLKPAFYAGAIREVGTSVEVPDGFKASWFAPDNTEAAKEAKKPKAPAKVEPKALSELAGEGAKGMPDVLA